MDLAADLRTAVSPRPPRAQLDDLNRERQDIERLITERAERYAWRRISRRPAGSCCSTKAGTPGVVGIVAGRISRKYNRPTIGSSVTRSELCEGLGPRHQRLQSRRDPRPCLCRLPRELGRASDGGGRFAAQALRLDEFRGQFDEAIRRSRDGAAGGARCGAVPAGLRRTQLTEQLMTELQSSCTRSAWAIPSRCLACTACG